MEVILNLSGKSYERFNTTQRRAASGRLLFDKKVASVEEFIDVYDKIRSKVREVIVDARPENLELNNDICNAVSVTCKVVTLDVEIDPDSQTYNFMEYDPSEL